MSGDAILVLNAGSSSIKFSLFATQSAELTLVATGQVEGIYTIPRFIAKDAAGKLASEKQWEPGAKLGHDGALGHIIDWLKATHGADHRLAAVGHRVVHGGTDFAAPVRVDAEVVAELEKLVPLAPLHQPHNLAPMRAMLQRAPELPQVACFDTAAHRSNPPVAQMFALPKELTDAGVRRYGFHGLSYEHIASVLAHYDDRAARGRTVVLHLGNGASMCALEAGRSVASTMGFTAVDGLPMGTRCGAIDPGVILYLMDERGMNARSVEKLIYNQSGLLGVSGVSSDMRVLLESSEPRAQLAVDLFVYRIASSSARLPRRSPSTRSSHRRHRRRACGPSGVQAGGMARRRVHAAPPTRSRPPYRTPRRAARRHAGDPDERAHDRQAHARPACEG